MSFETLALRRITSYLWTLHIIVIGRFGVRLLDRLCIRMPTRSVGRLELFVTRTLNENYVSASSSLYGVHFIITFAANMIYFMIAFSLLSNLIMNMKCFKMFCLDIAFLRLWW